jgi:hypothetical protein
MWRRSCPVPPAWSFPFAGPSDPADNRAIDRIDVYHYEMHLHPDARHSRLITDALVSKFALAGRKEEVERQVGRLPPGIDQVALLPTPTSLSDRLATILQLGEIFTEVGVTR